MSHELWTMDGYRLVQKNCIFSQSTSLLQLISRHLIAATYLQSCQSVQSLQLTSHLLAINGNQVLAREGLQNTEKSSEKTQLLWNATFWNHPHDFLSTPNILVHVLEYISCTKRVWNLTSYKKFITIPNTTYLFYLPPQHHSGSVLKTANEQINTSHLKPLPPRYANRKWSPILHPSYYCIFIYYIRPFKHVEWSRIDGTFELVHYIDWKMIFYCITSYHCHFLSLVSIYTISF